jgi:hypothetical protein
MAIAWLFEDETTEFTTAALEEITDQGAVVSGL